MAESMVAAGKGKKPEKEKGRTPQNPAQGPVEQPRKPEQKEQSSVSVDNANYQKELVSILSEIRSNQKSQEAKLASMTSKINCLEESLYECEDTSGQMQYSYGVNESEDDFSYAACTSDTPQPCVVGSASMDVNNSHPSVFKDIGSKYIVQEKLDHEIDDELASLTNNVFREGLTEERFKSLIADIGRPSNCDGLTKTKVNTVIWNLLSPEMHSADSKMQSIQDGVLKATTVLVKLLNMASDRLSRDELMMGTDAIGLLGHTNKLINNRRKSMHKRELNQEYHHLCSQSRGYTDMLYGDDVGRDVKELQDINRLGYKMRGSSMNVRGRGRPFYRGVARGRVMKLRGRGRASPMPKNSYNTRK